MSARFDPLQVIEAAYAATAEDEAWLRRIAEAFQPLARGFGITAVSFDLEGWRPTKLAGASLDQPPGLIERMQAVWQDLPQETLRAWFEPVPPVDTQLLRIRRRRAPTADTPVELSRAMGIQDVLGIMGLDPAGHAVQVTLPSASPIRLSPRLAHRLSLVAAHLAVARRLRSYATGALEAPAPDAVLDPSGKVAHAEGEAKAKDARASLAGAVLKLERARGRLRRTEPDEALGLWQGLVDGRWSLVDHVEADGRRVVLARHNPPGVRDPRALTARERDVLAYVAQGHGNKYVGYALGLSTTTVATHLRRALAKLGLSTRRDAIRLFEAAARAGRP
ncbi:MAG: LuxR C-terminal-related transcriptional regulator [Anaeromyxobacteraceae bacterium]